MSSATRKDGVFWRIPVASWQEYRDHLMRLSPQSLHARFGGAISPAFVAEHARRTLERGAEVHGWFNAGVMRGAVELCPLGDGRRAEAAFTVEDPYQARGVGSALFARTLRLARVRGLRELLVVCMPSNVRMQAVAAKFGGRISWRDGDVIALVDAPQPTALSHWREAVEEAHGFLTVLAERGRPRLRAAK